ncbi:MAG TPA: RES family NAD+ phosphorylase [Steroidobacteraceae bacterium]|nr:RES family NAD+ phosphorylase [Steroidobacteraceae bacterium]
MSSNTWTPLEVASRTTHCQLPLWRAVEAQHVVATRTLVDSRQEQELLEALLERGKPTVPPRIAAAGLDYLLYTPFRYPPPPRGSRFRAYGDPGVWYGAERIRTACAEVGYWRWRFVTDSVGLRRLDAVPHTIFQAVVYATAVDLRAPPFRRDQPFWNDPADYSTCQDFARVARTAQVQLIRYRSVRDPQHGGAGAVLDAAAFMPAIGVRRRQTWFLTVDRERASWIRAGTPRTASQAHEFTFDEFEWPPQPRARARARQADPGPV